MLLKSDSPVVYGTCVKHFNCISGYYFVVICIGKYNIFFFCKNVEIQLNPSTKQRETTFWDGIQVQTVHYVPLQHIAFLRKYQTNELAQKICLNYYPNSMVQVSVCKLSDLQMCPLMSKLLFLNECILFVTNDSVIN